MSGLGDQLLGVKKPAGTTEAPTGMKAGFAQRDITPDLGMELPGDYSKCFHGAIHDACKVRAAVLNDGKNTVAVVGVDVLIIRRPIVEAARDAISRRCGIAPHAILIAASHTHSGGPTGMILPGEYNHAPQWVQKLAYEESSCADAGYLGRVQRAIVEAVVQAHAQMTDVRLAAGYGSEPSVAFNRRFRMKSGSTVTHPGQGNPDIVEPAGPIDPQVGVIGAWDLRGRMTGCIISYACHATTGPGGASADYIHYLEQTVRGSFGADVPVVFLAGAAGDVTQVDNRSAHEVPVFGEAAAQHVGGRIGAEAVKMLLSLRNSAGALTPITFATETIQIKRRRPSSQRLASARELAQHRPPQGADPTPWIFAKEIVLLDAQLANNPVAQVEVQAIQLGPAIFLALPSECFCADGLEMKAGSGFPFTFPVSLANDCVGYAPTEEAFGPGGGGYETRLTSYSNLEPAAGRLMKEALLKLASKLKPGAIPAPPSAPPFAGRAWPYGDCPPEPE